MGFRFQFVLSPWAQETLYRSMMSHGGYATISFKRFLVDTICEAVEDEEIVRDAIAIAKGGMIARG